jgi:hypothetical protein
VTYGWIRNSLELGVMALSENLRPTIEKNPMLEILSAPQPMEFDSEGNLTQLLAHSLRSPAYGRGLEKSE